MDPSIMLLTLKKLIQFVPYSKGWFLTVKSIPHPSSLSQRHTWVDFVENSPCGSFQVLTVQALCITFFFRSGVWSSPLQTRYFPLP